MAESVGSLRVDVAANVAQIKTDMGKVKAAIADGVGGVRRSLDDMSRSSERTASVLSALRTGAMVALSKKLTTLIAQTAAYGAETDRLAKKLGVGAESLQKLQYAASQTGVSNDDLAGGLGDVARKISELAAGTTEGAARLALLGVRIDDLRGKRPDEAFAILADRLNAIKDPAYRSAAAIEIFGASADKMMQLVKLGSEGLNKLGQEANSFGLILDQGVLDKATKANKELAILGKVAQNAGIGITADLLPAITAFRELVTNPAFQKGVSSLTEWINAVAERLAIGFNLLTRPEMVKEQLEKATELQKEIAALDQQIALSQQGREAAEARGASGAEISSIETLLLNSIERRTELNGQLAALNAETRDMLSGKTAGTYGADRMRRTAHDGHATGAKIEDAGGIAAPVDVNKLRAYQKALEDIKFKTADANGAFRGLAPGTAEAARGLEIFSAAAQKTYIETGKLPANVRALNDAQMKLAGAMLTNEMLTPLEKYGRELERVKLMLDSGAISQETYARKLYELREGFVAAGGAAISLQAIGQGIGDAFARSFEDMIFAGKSWRDTLVSFAQDVAKEMMRAAVIKPIANSLTSSLTGSGGFLSTLMNANGNAFNQGRVMPFANGGVIGGPIAFPMRSGIGIAGEAGPEAIMPLERGPDGRLGVSNSGGGGASVVNIDARGSDAGVADRIFKTMAMLEKGRPNPIAQAQAFRKRFPTR